MLEPADNMCGDDRCGMCSHLSIPYYVQYVFVSYFLNELQNKARWDLPVQRLLSPTCWASSSDRLWSWLRYSSASWQEWSKCAASQICVNLTQIRHPYPGHYQFEACSCTVSAQLWNSLINWHKCFKSAVYTSASPEWHSSDPQPLEPGGHASYHFHREKAQTMLSGPKEMSMWSPPTPVPHVFFNIYILYYIIYIYIYIILYI